MANGKINKAFLQPGTCVLIPNETAGPYPWTMNNSPFFRQDITESNPGTPLNLTLTVVDINNNCDPIPNVKVDIWHCNKDGYYSEYNNQPGYLGTQNHSGETFFRGYQITDALGQVNFTTIYPGWYTGRVTHIHMQLWLNSVLKATSQMAFPDSLNTAVYNTSLYSAHGQNSIVNSTDNVFSDMTNTQYEMLTVTSNGSGYDASLTIGIALPTTGVINLEPETGGQFKLGQNFPNPFINETSIPFTLKEASNIKIELWDITGRKVATISRNNLSAGEHSIAIDLKSLGIKQANYAYQLEVTNSVGTFMQCKLMTADK
ncbi:MAG: intradiol ring-cleavage dioxygenase [Bacteroidetes bacterium]|jgi:protocatechuate 3,4-dioxygenase beta subunit|nr:intradiol ring-cleavage dioxygenase [Bacteroidota bacterium]